MSDLDDDELKATRILNGVDKEDDEKKATKDLLKMLEFASSQTEETSLKLNGIACKTLLNYIKEIQEKADMYDGLCK